MCGIAGIIHRNRAGRIGNEMTMMLQAMKHRGPDSTGFALYGEPSAGTLAMRFKVAEKEDLESGFEIRDQIVQRKAEVDERIVSLGGEVLDSDQPTEYAFLYRVRYDGDLRRFADFIEDAEGVEILSIGSALELVKDLGDANEVSAQYGMGTFVGTHAIGHVRMATESDVDIRSAHPYWAYPFGDISVVHNGQLTNYWSMRRDLERRGHRFVSDCDSELIAVYIADSLDRSVSLEDAMVKSVRELDGVFTYLVATTDSLGMAKDTMAAKPMVLYEGEEETLLASEEVAIRMVMPQEIETVDPYAGEVRVWRN
ncbi:MAG: class II glutamine amidotransferase [Gemmatimonadetes bacterium]|nr:class II glutamine amidotransferase [Gemmatimonadota bacterium]